MFHVESGVWTLQDSMVLHNGTPELFHVEHSCKDPLRKQPKTSVERWLLALVNSLLLHENLFDTLLHRNPSLQLHMQSLYSAIVSGIS